MRQYVLVAGLSGAGRSTATNALEDLGWFKIDNLPARLVGPVVELLEPSPATERVVLGVGTGGYSGAVVEAVEHLRSTGEDVTLIFLDASNDSLVNRFESTRRRHPLDDGTSLLSTAIKRERALLAPALAIADAVIDTTDLNVHELRQRLDQLFPVDAGERMHVTVMSFGFKHGLPRDVDLVMDLRFLPNPHWQPELRPLTGLDAPVRDYVLGQPETGEFLDRLTGLLELTVPAYDREGKTYLTIAMGCTGGRHRSVALAEALAHRSPLVTRRPVVRHRDLERSPESRT
ncbi:MAG: RNase adapter RapZ [Actinomycetota bacterium]